MNNNSQGRKWSLVINNPLDYGFTHEKICELVMKSFPDYFCLADEIASTGTFHSHIFIYSRSSIRFNTLKNRFPIAHIEKAYGTCQQNKDYILKSGKWKDSEKSESKVEGSFEEYGELPKEQDEKHPKMGALITAIKEGQTTAEIVEGSPNFAFKIADIDILRQTLLSEQYLTRNREIFVTYISGATGTGKTSGIYKSHNAKDICRITNYGHGKDVKFDAYKGQDVLVFEEFNGQIPIEDMLNYLDIYPLYLPARYADRIACYTHVYITSNVPLEEQYKNVQIYKPETWRAFLRRIHKTIEYRSDGTIIERSK